MTTKTKVLALVGAAAMTAATIAAPSVEITNVQQQYPWTNTVDITYTVAGVKTHQVEKILLTNETYFVAFEAKTAAGKAIPDVKGNTVFTNALVNGSGANQIAQWQPKLNLQETGCKITPSVFRGEENAYLVVNLETNKNGKYDYWYEPMSTQDASNKRYNTDEYKTRKMVFRRVNAGKYKVQRNTMTADMEKPYYIGVFEVTKAQYRRITADAVSTDKTAMNNISWYAIRDNALPTTSVTTNGPGVISRLNDRTGLYFDLPTEAMWEVACRATSNPSWKYFFGDSSADLAKYAWYTGHRIDNNTILAVGLLEPNQWGLYDILGNALEWPLDWNNTTMTLTQTPANKGQGAYYRGGSFREGEDRNSCGDRYGPFAPTALYVNVGFRLALIAQ